jgi:hypothetical protein
VSTQPASNPGSLVKDCGGAERAVEADPRLVPAAACGVADGVAARLDGGDHDNLSTICVDLLPPQQAATVVNSS